MMKCFVFDFLLGVSISCFEGDVVLLFILCLMGSETLGGAGQG